MTTYRLTPRALRDLDAIADYTLKAWGERQATKYLAELDQRFRWLAQNPKSGRERTEITEGYRSYTHGSHIVFYVIQADDIAIIGVPHGAMDIDAYFDQPG
ncbi:MAG: type II toxin-antitoxin system RelE/ParE family toxin [Hyphomonadaceae bacterium]